jgi:hypothetical protein
VIKDKRCLLLVPTGALTALPSHLLITQTPTSPKPSLKETGVYHDAQWVIKRQAIQCIALGGEPSSFESSRARRPNHQADDQLW